MLLQPRTTGRTSESLLTQQLGRNPLNDIGALNCCKMSS